MLVTVHNIYILVATLLVTVKNRMRGAKSKTFGKSLKRYSVEMPNWLARAKGFDETILSGDIIRETKKAILLKYDTDPRCEIWLPKSKIKIHDNSIPMEFESEEE